MGLWRLFLLMLAGLCRALAWLPLLFGAGLAGAADWLEHKAAPPR